MAQPRTKAFTAGDEHPGDTLEKIAVCSALSQARGPNGNSLSRKGPRRSGSTARRHDGGRSDLSERFTALSAQISTDVADDFVRTRPPRQSAGRFAPDRLGPTRLTVSFGFDSAGRYIRAEVCGPYGPAVVATRRLGGWVRDLTREGIEPNPGPRPLPLLMRLICSDDPRDAAGTIITTSVLFHDLRSRKGAARVMAAIALVHQLDPGGYGLLGKLADWCPSGLSGLADMVAQHMTSVDYETVSEASSASWDGDQREDVGEPVVLRANFKATEQYAAAANLVSKLIAYGFLGSISDMAPSFLAPLVRAIKMSPVEFLKVTIDFGTSMVKALTSYVDGHGFFTYNRLQGIVAEYDNLLARSDPTATERHDFFRGQPYHVVMQKISADEAALSAMMLTASESDRKRIPAALSVVRKVKVRAMVQGGSAPPVNPVSLTFNGMGGTGKSTMAAAISEALAKSLGGNCHRHSSGDRYSSGSTNADVVLFIDELVNQDPNSPGAASNFEVLWRSTGGDTSPLVMPDLDDKGTINPRYRAVVSCTNSYKLVVNLAASPFAIGRRLGNIIEPEPRPEMLINGAFDFDRLYRAIATCGPERLGPELDQLYLFRFMHLELEDPARPMGPVKLVPGGHPSLPIPYDSTLSHAMTMIRERIQRDSELISLGIAASTASVCPGCGFKGLRCDCGADLDTMLVGPREDAETAAAFSSFVSPLRSDWGFFETPRLILSVAGSPEVSGFVSGLGFTAVSVALATCSLAFSATLGLAVFAFVKVSRATSPPAIIRLMDLRDLLARIRYVVGCAPLFGSMILRIWPTYRAGRSAALVAPLLAGLSGLAIAGLVYSYSGAEEPHGLDAEARQAATRKAKLERRKGRRVAAESLSRTGAVGAGPGDEPVGEGAAPIGAPERIKRTMSLVGPSFSAPRQGALRSFVPQEAAKAAAQFAAAMGPLAAGLSPESLVHVGSSWLWLLSYGGSNFTVFVNGERLYLNAHTARQFPPGPHCMEVLYASSRFGKPRFVVLDSSAMEVDDEHDIASVEFVTTPPPMSAKAALDVPDLSDVGFAMGSGLVLKLDLVTGVPTVVPVKWQLVKGPPPTPTRFGSGHPYHFRVQGLASDFGNCMSQLFSTSPLRVLGYQHASIGATGGVFLPNRLVLPPYRLAAWLNFDSTLKPQCAAQYLDTGLVPIGHMPGRGGATLSTGLERTPFHDEVVQYARKVGLTQVYDTPIFEKFHFGEGAFGTPLDYSFYKNRDSIRMTASIEDILDEEVFLRGLDQVLPSIPVPPCYPFDDLVNRGYGPDMDLTTSAGPGFPGKKADYVFRDSEGVLRWDERIMRVATSYYEDLMTSPVPLARVFTAAYKDETVLSGKPARVVFACSTPDLILDKWLLDPVLAVLRLALRDFGMVGLDCSQDWSVAFRELEAGGRLEGASVFSSDASSSDKRMQYSARRLLARLSTSCARYWKWDEARVLAMQRVILGDQRLAIVITPQFDVMWMTNELLSGLLVTLSLNVLQGSKILARVARSLSLSLEDDIPEFMMSAVYGDDFVLACFHPGAAQAIRASAESVGALLKDVYNGTPDLDPVDYSRLDFLGRQTKWHGAWGKNVGALGPSSIYKMLLFQGKSKAVTPEMMRRCIVESALLHAFQGGEESWLRWEPLLRRLWWWDVPEGAGSGPPSWDDLCALHPPKPPSEYPWTLSARQYLRME